MSHNGHSATLYAVWVRTYSSLSAGCSSTSNGGIFMYNSVQYIKLADGKCWTRYSQGRATFDGANSLCPSGTSVPNITQANALLTAYGATSTTTYGYNTYYINSAALYNATGWYGTGSDAFRVSTLNPSSTSYSYVLLVRPTEAFSNLMGHLSPCVALTSSCPVVCVAN